MSSGFCTFAQSLDSEYKAVDILPAVNLEKLKSGEVFLYVLPDLCRVVFRRIAAEDCDDDFLVRYVDTVSPHPHSSPLPIQALAVEAEYFDLLYDVTVKRRIARSVGDKSRHNALDCHVHIGEYRKRRVALSDTAVLDHIYL